MLYTQYNKFVTLIPQLFLRFDIIEILHSAPHSPFENFRKD